MTLVQLQYILAVARWGSFTTAAEKCFVTQPTLSMQVQKLEEELGVQIFDRNKKPVAPTPLGQQIVAQAAATVGESMRIKDLIDQAKGSVSGDFHLGVIPSVMPSLLPLFLKTYIKKYPKVTLHLEELQTADMVQALKEKVIDAGIAATPLGDPAITEEPLYYEPMVALVGNESPLLAKKKLTPADLGNEQLLLLENGHCFRNSVLNLCQEARKNAEKQRFRLSSGNFDTLIGLTKEGFGTTVLPYLTAMALPEEDRRMLREFEKPVPAREVSLIRSTTQLRQKVSESVRETIRGIIRGMILLDQTKVVSPIEGQAAKDIAL